MSTWGRATPSRPSSDELVLDIACGNGQFARRLADLGARVVAGDFSERLVDLARWRSARHADPIEYRLLDATDEVQVLALGRQRFDAAVCTRASTARTCGSSRKSA